MSRADLCRINGAGSELSELLEASVVDTMKGFCTRVPANLHAKRLEVNDSKRLVRR